MEHLLSLKLNLAGLLVFVVVNMALWAWVWFVPARVVRVQRLWKSGALGLALPGLIMVTPGGDNEWVLAHEEGHQEQMRAWSPLGVSLLLGWFYLVHWVRILHREKRWAGFWELWQLNPVERDADARARRALAEIGRIS
ncbi:MAG: hypothetical protein ACSHYB_05300 [Roseibacillus sp.]